MGTLVRFGISLGNELLEAFDKLCASRGYANRSEAIRDLIRQELAEEQWQQGGICSGTLTLVYDHHRNDLARRLMAIQHEHHDLILASLHVHLDHANCMETLALKGKAENVRQLAEKLIATRGVKYGAFNRALNAEEQA